MGDLFRANISQQTELGQLAKSYMDAGNLVPDEVTIAMAKDRMEAPDAENGFLLDGFPRNASQADALGEEVEKRGRRLTAVLLINAPDEEVIRRLSGRRTCSEGHVYHVENDPPKHEGVCDQDGKPLRQRDDDKPEVIQKRLDTYHEHTKPLIEYYEQHGLLRTFDGTRSPGEVHDHIRATLATLRLEERL
jgi:adenylate kinase